MFGSLQTVLSLGLALLISVASAQGADPVEPVGDKEPVSILRIFDAFRLTRLHQQAEPKTEESTEPTDKVKDAEAKAAPAAKPEEKKPEAEKSTTPANKPEAKEPAEKKEEKEEAKKEPEEKKPATVKVKQELVKVEVELAGHFDAKRATEIKLEPEQWRTFKVVRAVEHGREVRKGDVLVEFDVKEIDRTIADRRTELRLAEMSLEQSEIELELTKQSSAIETEYTSRLREMTEEDRERFFEKELPLSRKMAEASLKQARDYLIYEKEELRQLERMYNADDLTEETEEIILKRQRDSVARAELYLVSAEAEYEELMEVDMPRREESTDRNTRRQLISVTRTETTLPLTLRRAAIATEKLAIAHERSKEKFEELLADRKLMTVRAPADGIVYYGQFEDGKWGGGAALEENLRPDATAPTDEVIMTILQKRPVSILATVAEKDLGWIKPDARAWVVPTGLPDALLSARIRRVDRIPGVSGKFQVELNVRLTDQAEMILPGMACKAKVTPYLKEKALTVPASAIETDPRNPTRKYVYRWTENGKPRRVRVEVGQKSGENVEILEGVALDDELLKEPPQ